jgi:hypothetical protein
MNGQGQSARILDYIKRFPGLADDELAAHLDIASRHTVHLICRTLAQQGHIRRRPVGPGKLGNFAIAAIEPPTFMPAVDVDVVGATPDPEAGRPALTLELLLEGGFELAAKWMLGDDDNLAPPHGVPEERGVYAFVVEDVAQYVGVATGGLSKRLQFYTRPPSGLVSNQRLNRLLVGHLRAGAEVLIYTATPPDLTWNGLPVNGSAGLEFGLIGAFDLPWNVRGAAA